MHPSEWIQPRTFRFPEAPGLPGNPELPALVYPRALSGRPNEALEVFARNGWLGGWTAGVYSYHHYHSNAHEALAVVQGTAVLQLGGDSGLRLPVSAGDVLVLPAGTAHKCISSGPGFAVSGAYPDGMDYNLRTEDDADRLQSIRAEIAKVPLPLRDPLYGEDGPLPVLWGGAYPDRNRSGIDR
ncbi:cupin domain-containing protein [Paenibacillus sp. CN-4]|uniref:cupin domain-containing protein n=1 Tax=Paenibacillus nanchangensis TaxID=3348343 RepID=UPI00397D8CF3